MEPVEVEDALALGHDRRHQRLAGDVDRRTAHVEHRVDREQQADALQRQAVDAQECRVEHADEVVLLNTGAGVIYPETVAVDVPTVAREDPLPL